MPTRTSRSPFAPRHWWRSDRGLVQQQISEWVSRKLFLFPTCWNHPAASDVVIIVHFCLIVLAAWQQQVSLLKCRMDTWRTSEKEGGQSQGISSWPTPLEWLNWTRLAQCLSSKPSFQYWKQGFELPLHWLSFPVWPSAPIPWRIAATDCHVYSSTWCH